MMYVKLSGFSDEIDSAVDRQFQVLNKLGMCYFEVRGVDKKNVSELSGEEREDLKRKMDLHQIHASSLGSPVGKVLLEEPFEEHFEMFKRVVDTAEHLGSRYIRIFSFYHNTGMPWTDEESEEVLLRLAQMIRYVKDKDIVLLHENEKDIFGDTAEHCAILMRELHGEHFRAVFDPANFVQCGEDAWQAYQVMKPYIEYVHVKDACKDSGQVVPAGHGDGKIQEIVEDLLQAGYKGFFSLEPHLGSFEGLDKLEVDNKMMSLPKSGEDTFKLAYNEFQKILSEV